MEFKGKVSKKALFFLKKFSKKKRNKPNFSVNIEKTNPQHIGLGSVTLLALYIGNAI